ncbi:MAG: hypothetical protein WCK47_08090 [bacterium]
MRSSFTRKPGRILAMLLACAAASVCCPSAGRAVNARVAAQIGGWCNTIVMKDDYLGVGMGPNVEFWNISSPGLPVKKASVKLPQVVNGVAQANSMGYATYGTGFQIIDGTNILSPRLRGRYVSPSPSEDLRGVVVSGTIAYVAAGTAGLRVLDVSNPDAPSPLALYDTPGNAIGLAVSGNRAYVAIHDAGLLILDVTNPSAPTLLGSYDTPGFAFGVTVSGTRAYVADGFGTENFLILDVSNPAAPFKLGSCALSGFPKDIQLFGNTAYVAMSTEGVGIVDITNSAAPTVKGSFYSHGDACQTAIKSTPMVRIAYIADGFNGLVLANMTSPANPPLIGKYGMAGDPLDVAIAGTKAYVTDYTDGIQIIDIANPFAPALLSEFHLSGSEALALQGSLLYVAVRTGGLNIVDVSNPLAPALKGSCAPGDVIDVAVQGNMVYAATIYYGLKVIDASNPAAPFVAGTCKMPSTSAIAVVVAGSTAYVVEYYNNLHVIDVSNPASPAIFSTFKSSEVINNIAVSGNYVYLASGVAGLQIVDVSYPSGPYLRGACGLPNYANCVTVDGTTAWVGSYVGDVAAVDVSDPDHPSMRSHCITPRGQRAIAVSQDVIYTADDMAGIGVLIDRSSRIVRDDTFPTGAIAPPGSLSGWSSFGFSNYLGWPDYDPAHHAYQAYVTANPDHYRVVGVSANWAEWMPYSNAGPNHFVRAKYYVYAGGQSNPSDGNQIPNMRLRAQTRFAVNSMLEVFNHTNDLSPAQQAMEQELRPSTDPARPSLYRVDFDPIDAPYLQGNPAIEGIQRAFEAYAIFPQDNGIIAMCESSLGVYHTLCLPESGAPDKVYTRTATDAGDLRVMNPVELDIANYIPGANPGEYAVRDPAPAPGTLPTYAEGNFGIKFDSANVPSNRVGFISREFTPGATFPSLVRVEEGKQYKIRWHLVSTQQSNLQSQIRLRTRTVKFAWSQKLEIGGAWATGGALLNANNTIAQQSLPGVGCVNPDKYTTDTQGGWYTVLMSTPMSADIRPEFPDGTPLSVRMPNICTQPGPGVDAASRRDLRIGCDLIDTLSYGLNRDLEKGNYTLDRVEVRVYDAVPD